MIWHFRMLGYEDAVCAVTSARFGSAESGVPILMDNMLCRGSEKALDHCDFNGWLNHGCTHREDAGVICEDRKHNTNSNNCYACKQPCTQEILHTAQSIV